MIHGKELLDHIDWIERNSPETIKVKSKWIVQIKFTDIPEFALNGLRGHKAKILKDGWIELNLKGG